MAASCCSVTVSLHSATLPTLTSVEIVHTSERCLDVKREADPKSAAPYGMLGDSIRMT